MWEPETRVGLIDGDLVAFSCAWVTNKMDHYSAALGAVKEMLLNIRDTLELDDYKLFLTGRNNFRKQICPEYKIHRKKFDKPKYLDEVYQYLQEKWRAEWTEGIEADDAIGIDNWSNPGNIICSSDKDLNQLVGYHYDWRKYQVYEITEEDANLNFWSQMLIGDRSDNITGVRGIGPVKANKLLANSLNRFEIVKELYDDKERFIKNYKLLTILQKEIPEENWVELERIYDL